VVPARSGSKGLPDKNIRNLGGEPLLCHSVRHGIQSSLLSGLVLWTDSQQYLEKVAHFSGLLDVGLRTKHVDDYATDAGFLIDLDSRLAVLNIEFDAFVLLRPTSSVRPEGLIDECINEICRNWDFYDSLRTVSIADKTPFKMWFGDDGPNNTIVGRPLSHLLGGIRDAHSMPRQVLPEVFVQNGMVDIIKRDVLNRLRSSAGDRVLLHLTRNDAIDIDTFKDFNKAVSSFKCNTEFIELKNEVDRFVPISPCTR